MSDRMEKTREALNWAGYDTAPPDAYAAALAEVEEWETRQQQADAWFENHFVDEDGEPAGLTLAQMLEHVYRWGDGAWGQAGSMVARAETAEADRDAALKSRALNSQVRARQYLALQSEIDRLRDALAQIRDEATVEQADDIARAALGEQT